MNDTIEESLIIMEEIEIRNMNKKELKTKHSETWATIKDNRELKLKIERKSKIDSLLNEILREYDKLIEIEQAKKFKLILKFQELNEIDFKAYVQKQGI